MLRYAARVVGLAGPEAAALEDGLTTRLAAAESNARTLGSGREIYFQRARPHLDPPLRIAAGLAAARALAPAAAASPAWELSCRPDGDLKRHDRRTGRGTRVAVALEREGSSCGPRCGPSPMAPGSCWRWPTSRSGSAAPSRRRSGGASLRRLLTVEEHARLEQGEELRPLVRQALTRRVQGLAEDRSPAALAAVTELLVLLDQLGQAVPFDAQTAFYRVWQAHGGGRGRHGAPGPPHGVRSGLAGQPTHRRRHCLVVLMNS